MELIIDRNELFRWLSKTQNISEKRSTMPILANALLKCENDAIHIYATDLEVGIHGVIKGEIKQPGAITFPSKMVFEIVRELPSAKITLHMTEMNQLHLRCGKSFYSIMTLAPDKYPSFPTFENLEFIPIKSSSFLDMIEKTSFAVSLENIRFNLSGALLEKVENGKGERIRMVATDGHKLAMIDKPVEKADLNIKISRKVIISRKGIHEMKRLLEEADSSVSIGFDEKSVVLKSVDTTLMARLVEGEFPEYKEVIPHTFKRTLKVNRKLFMEAIKRVSALSSDRSQVIKFSMDRESMKLVYSDPDVGEAEDEIQVTSYEGDPLEIGFNAVYFLETCNVLDCDEILIKLNDPLNPGVVFPVKEDLEYLCVIMPIKIV